MIVAKSPLRISLGGGGTDLPSYYRRKGGFVLAATINKYVYVTINRPFGDAFILKYSDLETVSTIKEIRHNIFREVIRSVNPNSRALEIHSIADIPSGTGLGSSGSFTTALLAGLLELEGSSVNSEELANRACEIEINVLKEPVGKQDQYASAFGGIAAYTFAADDSVGVRSLDLSQEAVSTLTGSLCLFFTGFSRSASDILVRQATRTEENDSKTLRFLDKVKSIGILSEDALIKGDMELLAQYFSEHWNLKKNSLENVSNETIDGLYEVGLQNGALAGKVVGAGGGGFLLFIAKDRDKLIRAMAKLGLRETPFSFTMQGTTVNRV